MVETKEVYFKKTPTNLRHVWIRHFIETYRSASPLQHHQFVKCSNIRGPITDLTRQTYGDVRFDKSTIRHRIFEYSGLTESKCRSLNYTPLNIIIRELLLERSLKINM